MGVRFLILSACAQGAEREISYQFDQERIVIGRGAGADIRLPFRTVSEVHATVFLENANYVIVDNNSTNGTRVNGERLIPDRPKSLRNGDEIDVGGYVVSISIGVVVTEPITAERTAELARRLVREVKSPDALDLELPYLVVLNGLQAGQRVKIHPPLSRILVGRGESCQLKLADADVSREHFEVIRDIDGVLIRNLDSKNGVMLGDQLIQERRIKSGNELVVGATRLRYEDPAEDSIQALANQPDQLLIKEPTVNANSAQNSAELEAYAQTESEDKAIEEKLKKKRASSPLSFGIDLVVYSLALVILFLSIAGLVFLLRMR
jgi:pSer/pThr/pTyr-binding forkhead associated (FHA) protein